jgi:hypothetical protein
LILAFVLGVAALLPPGGSRFADRKVWHSAHNLEQFLRWSQMLAKVGVHLAPEQIEAYVWTFAQAYLKFQAPLHAGAQPLVSQLGLGQGWGMFSNPETHPARLHVDIDRGHGFETIYVSRSDEYTWRRSEFDHNRMRKLIGRITRDQSPVLYKSLVTWVAAQAQQDFPDARRVRVRRYRFDTKLTFARGTSYDAEGAFEAARVVELGAAR